MRVRLAICLAAFALSATVAAATPPRYTGSDDRLVGATQTHVYVLRDIADNLGSYYEELRDQHLVEISLDTGEATRFWPLRRMQVSTLATGDFLLPGRVSERAGETFDMMRVLADTGAAPLSPQSHGIRDFSLRDGALLRNGTRVGTPFAIRAAGRAQLAILRDAYPPMESEEAYRKADRIDFSTSTPPASGTVKSAPKGMNSIAPRNG